MRIASESLSTRAYKRRTGIYEEPGMLLGNECFIASIAFFIHPPLFEHASDEVGCAR